MGAGAESLKYRFQWTFPVEFSPHDDDTLYVCSNVVHRSTDDGASMGDHQPGPDAQRSDKDRVVGRTDHRRQPRRRDLLHDLRLPRVAARSGRVLGWLGRWTDPRLARRRPDLAERHASGPAGVGDDQHHRAVAARRCQRRTSPPPATSRTTCSPYLYRTNDYGADVDAHHQRHPGRRVHARHPRGPEPPRPAVLRHRARHATCRSTTA